MALRYFDVLRLCSNCAALNNTIENSKNKKIYADVTKVVNKGVRQMGWYMEQNTRVKNKLKPEQIAEEYVKKGQNTVLKLCAKYKK